MILSWMAYASLCAALCAIAAACVDSVMQNRLRQRRGVWIMSMLASVLLPLVVPFLVPPETVVDTIAEQSAPRQLVASITQASPAIANATVDWETVAIVMWIAVSTLLAVSLIASSARLHRRMRGYRSARIDGQSLLLSDDFGPAVVGLLHTTIVLPTWALSLSDAERKLVVAHEVEHQRASDPAVSISALLFTALFPWNAALWWQLSRLRLAIEFDCDSRVVTRSGADPFAYGNLLVTAHENAGQSRVAALALAPIRSALGKRINALVATGSQSVRRTLSRASVAALALAVLGFAPVPAVRPAVASATIQSSRSDSVLMNPPGVYLVEQRALATPAGTLTESRSGTTKRPRQQQVRNEAPPASAPMGGTYSMSPRRSPSPTLGAVAQLDSAPSRVTPDSRSNTISPTSGEFGARSGAVMRAGETGGVGGSLRKAEVLKSYKGGFMDAEVPARPDTTPPPIR